MKSMRMPLAAVVAVVLLGVGLLGCPPNVGLQLLVSTDTLDFGSSSDELVLRVHKTYTGSRMEPLVVSADKAWIQPQNCLHVSDGCVSRGPDDAIRIPVAIDRGRMSLGLNTGKIYLNSRNASLVSVTVLAREILAVDFVALSRQIGLGQPAEFQDMSAASEEAGEIQSWFWEFGDGAVSTRRNPSHLYTAAGRYDVSLTIVTNEGVRRTVVKPAYIKVETPSNTVDFFASATNVFVNEEITFNDTSAIEDTPVLSRMWDFGDGNTSTATTPRHRYAAPGVYTVSLTITTSDGDMTAVKENYIIVRSAGALRANFTYDASGGAVPYVGETVKFFDLSESGRGDITSWQWDFGDGATSEDQNPLHSYAAMGLYTVTLTVTSDFGADTTERTLNVKFRPPRPDFRVEPRTSGWLGTSFFFIDLSVPGYGEIIDWQWDFGDGNTASGQNTVHVYTTPGEYSVTLTVTANDEANSTASITKSRLIDVWAPPEPPQPAFTYSPRLALVGDRVVFDASGTVVGDEPGMRFQWDFGDDTIANGRVVSHRFTERGTYEVTLRVITDSTEGWSPPGIAVTQTVVVDLAPTAAFDVTPPQAYTYMDAVTFNVVEQPVGARPILNYAWEFGDGEVSGQAMPTHVYESQGLFTVLLRLSFRHSASLPTDPLLERTVTQPLRIWPSIADYINRDDGCFGYSFPIQQNIVIAGQHLATAYLVPSFTSQCWNPDNAVRPADRRWTHAVTIIEPLPQFKNSDTAMLFVDGGSRTSVPGLEFAQMAILTGTTVVHLKNVPSQPIVFSEEIIRAPEDDLTSDLILRSRREDAAIAYSYDQYLQSYLDNNGHGNHEWPLLFPMTKAAVKAMDMAEEILDGRISDFVVAGASKRGWTTWLTGAVDPRVKAIAPIVINVLNMTDHLEHHRAAYGYWSPAIYDYAQERVFDRLLPGSDGVTVTPEARRLLDYVDPYEYSLRGRYPMPKFMLNATGDEFFVPDTAEYFFHDLEGEAHQTFVPNVGHGMGLDSFENLTPQEMTDPNTTVGMFLAWYMAITQDQPRPEFTYTFEEDGAIRVTVDPQRLPANVYMWSATSEGRRDFRNHIVGDDAWTRTPLTLQSGGSTGAYYITHPVIDPPTGDYTAYFVQLEYANTGVELPGLLAAVLQAQGYSVPNMMFSSRVRVTPEAFPEFTGYIANAERPDAVLFDQNKMPVAVVYGTPWEMGYYYGQLLAPRINAFIRDSVYFYQQATGASQAQLRNVWQGIAPFLDSRLHEEMEGIAAAPGVTASLDQIQLAHAAALLEGMGPWTSSGAFAYRGMSNNGNAMKSATLNAPSPLYAHQCAVMYIPDDGVPHTVLTHAGLVFGRTGVNLGGISAVEIADPPVLDPGSGMRIDPVSGELTPFTGREPGAQPVIRSILYDASSLRDAVAMAKAAPYQRPTTLLLGDGRNEERGARLRIDPIQGVLEERYDTSATDFGIANRPGVLYSTISLLQPDLQAALDAVMTPQLSLPALLGIASQPPFAQPGANALNVVFDSALLNIFVAVAQGGNEAFQDNFDAFNMQMLLP